MRAPPDRQRLDQCAAAEAPTGSSTPITLTTSSTGEGKVTLDFRAPTIPVGTRFDVMFRLLNDLSAPTSVLLSSCFTVSVL